MTNEPLSNKILEASELNIDEVMPDWEALMQTFSGGTEKLEDLTLEEQGQDYWENLFNQMNFPGMDLMAVPYFPQSLDIREIHTRYRRLIRDFVRLLSYHYTNDLRSAGVSEEGLFYMKKGKLPENFTVHLKYPLDYAGNLTFENLVFMQASPFHELIHLYIERQLLGPMGLLTPERLYVPVPIGKVYIPFGMFTGSGGKNKQDRSAIAGYSAMELRELALKNMPGR